MKKIYIDVTQLYAWRGRVTGIQRVMYEISSRFIGDARFEPVFLKWHKGTASFYTIDFNDIEKFLQENEKKSNKNTRSRRRAQYVALFKRVYHHVPLSRTMYNIYSLLRGRVTKLLLRSSTVVFDTDSLLFMPHGGVWESDTYISEILKLREKRNVKLAPILFDMCPIISPQFVVKPVQEAFANYMQQVLPKSDLVLAISDNTANDAKKWQQSTGLSKAIITKVFRLGDEIGSGSRKPKLPTQNFILCVGTIEARKNHTALYYAYKLAAAQGQSLPKIVIAGRRGWMSGDTYELMINDATVKDSFIFLHNASDEELSWLYKNALFTVYPSFYEGWGLPIAESLLRGTPCLASETSSMKEIGGDLVEYFSPYSPDQIKDKILEYAQNPDSLNALRKNIKKQYKATSWDMSYSTVADELVRL